MHHFGVVIYDEYFRTVVCTVILTYLVCHFLTVVQWKSHLLVLLQRGFLVGGIAALIGRQGNGKDGSLAVLAIARL